MSEIDRAITLVAEIKEAVAAISETYALMPPMIDEEHAAIEASDLDKVEALSARKLFLGAQLDNLFKKLKDSCRGLAGLTQLARSAQNEQQTLSASFSNIEQLLDRYTSAGLDIEQLNSEFDALKDSFEKFATVKEAAQKKIEVNRLVLGKMLHARQENYRFWQEVVADTMAAYGPGGKQKASRSNSILNVKA